MVYKEYLIAAKRHRETCQQIFGILKDSKGYLDASTKQKLLINTFYLSGYVIECIVSYAFFKVINYKDNYDVYDLDKNNSNGYKFSILFSDHNYNTAEKKFEIIRLKGGVLSSSTPLIGDVKVENDILQLFKEWNTKVRYTTQNISIELNQINVQNFFELADSVYIKLNRI